MGRDCAAPHVVCVGCKIIRRPWPPADPLLPQRLQHVLSFNTRGFGAVPPDLALNPAVSFAVPVPIAAILLLSLFSDGSTRVSVRAEESVLQPAE
jgi:hypothetical protein